MYEGTRIRHFSGDFIMATAFTIPEWIALLMKEGNDIENILTLVSQTS